MHATTLPANYQEARQTLLDLGYTEGVPGHIRAEAVVIDTRCCRSVICPSCSRRGMTYRPFALGNEYRVLAQCERCGTCEQV